MTGPVERVRWFEVIEIAAPVVGSAGTDYSDFETAVQMFV